MLELSDINYRPATAEHSVLNSIQLKADSGCPLLISGDSGSGKTMKEFMPQIMWPSLYLKGGIEDSEVHQRIIEFARQGLRIIQNQNM